MSELANADGATPAMLEAGKRTMRTLFMRDTDEAMWGDALARIYASMRYAQRERNNG